MYQLTKINTVKEAVEVLKLFDDTMKFYWINALSLCEGDKGFLVKWFKL